MGRAPLPSSDHHDPPATSPILTLLPSFRPDFSWWGRDRVCSPRPPAATTPPSPQLLQSTASFPPPPLQESSGQGGAPDGCVRTRRALLQTFERSWPSGQKSMRAAANDVAVRTRARIGSAPLRTEHSLDPAIGPRDLSLVAVASRRVLAVTSSAQARNVTREKPKQGPRRQVVILGDSAPRVPFSCQQRCCSLIVRSRQP